MKYLNVGLIFMLIVLSQSISRAADDDFDEDDYDFDDYNDYDNTTSPIADYSEENDEKPITTKTTATTKLPSSIQTTRTVNVTVITTTAPTPTVSILKIESSPNGSNCPEKCKCSEGTQFIDCSKLNLTSIPKMIPTNAIKIDLSENQIYKLQIDDFPNEMNTRDLILSKNQITSIDEKVIGNFPRLDTLDLSSNRLTKLQPNIFSGAKELMQLSLDFNPIEINSTGSFLNLTELGQLGLKGCNLTELFDQTFSNLSGLAALNLAGNQFHETINVKSFEPLKHLGKLQIPSMPQDTLFELCRVLTAIDVIQTERYDVSCFELVSGDNFDESTMTIAPKGNVENTQEEATTPTQATTSTTTTTTTTTPKSTTTTTKKATKATKTLPLSGTTTNTSMPTSNEDFENKTESSLSSIEVDENGEEEVKGNTVNISSESLKNILIGIIVVTSVGLVIGLLCRSDVFGIKTKLCRRKKRRPAQTDQVSPAEEVPLNKV